MFVIRMVNGEEIHGAGDEKLTINPDTGVLSVTRTDRHGESTTHYSPTAWRSVTHRVNGTAINPSRLAGAAPPLGAAG